MFIQGRVMSVNNSEFKGQSGEAIKMCYYDVYDSTAKLQSCESVVKPGFVEPVVDSIIRAEIGRVKVKDEKRRASSGASYSLAVLSYTVVPPNGSGPALPTTHAGSSDLISDRPLKK